MIAAAGARGQRVRTEFSKHDAPPAATCRQYRPEGMINHSSI